MNDALISIKPEYTKKILCGEKTVEFRRRKPSFLAGTCLWIYSTLPDGAIRGRSRVVKVISGKPESIWRKYKLVGGVDRISFVNYTSGCDEIFAIELTDVQEFKSPISLSLIRKKISHFQPPQFFTWLLPATDISVYLNNFYIEKYCDKNQVS